MPAGLHSHTHLLARPRQSTVDLLRLLAMRQPFFLEFSGVCVHGSYLLKLGVKIYSYNDHCSAPFSRACWLALAPPTLLGRGSRHCHGINSTQNALGRGLSLYPHISTRFHYAGVAVIGPTSSARKTSNQSAHSDNTR